MNRLSDHSSQPTRKGLYHVHITDTINYQSEQTFLLLPIVAFTPTREMLAVGSSKFTVNCKSYIRVHKTLEHFAVNCTLIMSSAAESENNVFGRGIRISKSTRHQKHQHFSYCYS